MISWLLLGFAMGLRHSLEADHVAAVASLSARAGTPRDRVRVAWAWGLGHALTLLAVALLWAATGVAIPEPAQPYVEAAAGLLLVFLGVDLISRRPRESAHARDHRHSDGRALLVGSVHGLAGSAWIGLLAAGSADPSRAVAYTGVFGIGAAAGMVALSTVLSFPLRSARIQAIAVMRASRISLAAVSIAIGIWISARSVMSVASSSGA